MAEQVDPKVHAQKMAAADAELARLAERRKAALKKIEAADNKYRSYLKAHS